MTCVASGLPLTNKVSARKARQRAEAAVAIPGQGATSAYFAKPADPAAPGPHVVAFRNENRKEATLFTTNDERYLAWSADTTRVLPPRHDGRVESLLPAVKQLTTGQGDPGWRFMRA
jgi:hypothetical protein